MNHDFSDLEVTRSWETKVMSFQVQFVLLVPAESYSRTPANYGYENFRGKAEVITVIEGFGTMTKPSYVR